MPEPNGQKLNPTQELGDKLDRQWRETRAWAQPWRHEARVDREYYAGNQWSDEQKRELERQGRPATVINEIARTINNLTGRERDSRLDYKVLPRGESDVMTADAMTKALRYLTDTTLLKYTQSWAFEDMAKGPVGWVEVGYDDTDPFKEPLFVRLCPWDEMYWDPFARDLKLSDCRYLIKQRWLDWDVAFANWPEQEEALKGAIANKQEEESTPSNLGDDYGNRDTYGWSRMWGERDWCDTDRKRVRLREHWWWELVDAFFIQYPDGRVVEFDQKNPRDLIKLQEPGAQLIQRKKRQFFYAVVADKIVLSYEMSPYKHQRFPYVPLWAYKNEKQEPYGVIRVQRGPQDELNTSRSRFNESIRSRWVIASEAAFGRMSVDQVRRELAHSNFVLKLAKPGEVQVGSDKADGQMWLELMALSKKELDEAAGMNEASYGDKSNEKSGRAIEARVAQQGLNNGRLFDNLRLFRLQVGEMLLALMQQYYPRERIARIVESAVVQEGMALQQAPDLMWIGAALAGPIEQMRYDVAIEDVAETTTERQAAMQEAIDLVGMLPEPAKAAIAPFIIRMSDFKDKEEMARVVEQAMQMASAPQASGQMGDMGQLPPGMGGPQPMGPQPPVPMGIPLDPGLPQGVMPV